VRQGSLEELEPNIAAYRKGLEGAGHPGDGKVFLRAPVYGRRHDQAARDEPEDSIMYFLSLSRRAAGRFGDPRRRPAIGIAGSPRAPAADHQL